MKRWYLIIGLLIVTVAYAAGLKIERWNELRFGTGAGDRIITFDQSPDANSVKLTVDTATDSLTLNRPSIFSGQANFDALVDIDANLDLTGNLIQTGDITSTGNLQITGKSTVISTTEGSKPCPVMTEAQKDAIATPADGDCVYDSTNNKLFTYDSNAVKWVEAGGGAGGSRLQLLDDNSFESGVAEGTCTNCTASAETTSVLITPNNAQALKMNFTGLAGDYTIDKTTSAQWSNVSGKVSCYIKTTVPSVDFCSRDNGADVDCVDVIPDGIYREYVIPTIIGTTSHGYKVDHPTTEVGDVFVDECNVIANDSTFEIAQSEHLGFANVPTTTSCSWSTTSTSYASFAADGDCPVPTISGNAIIKAPATKIPAIVLPQGSPAGTYEIQASGSFVGDPTGTGDDSVCQYRFSDGINTFYSGNVGQTNSGSGGNNIHGATLLGTVHYDNALPSDTTIEIQAKKFNSSVAFCYVSAGSLDQQLNISVKYYPPKSKIVSQKQEVCSAVYENMTTQTISQDTEAIPFRDKILDNCNIWTDNVTSGSGDKGSYTPSKNGMVTAHLTIAQNASGISNPVRVYKDAGELQTCGQYYNSFSRNGVSCTFYAEVGSDYTFRVTAADINLNTTTSHKIFIYEHVGTPTIIGKFKEYPRVPGATRVEQIRFSRAGGTGTVTSFVGDNPISGNCTVATPSVCTFATPFTATPKCLCTTNTTGRRGCTVSGQTTTTVSITAYNAADIDTTTSTSIIVDCLGER